MNKFPVDGACADLVSVAGLVWTGRAEHALRCLDYSSMPSRSRLVLYSVSSPGRSRRV